MRNTFIALLHAAALTACATAPASDIADDPACSVEPRARARGDRMPWDLALDRTPDVVCPADDPACDRLDGPDAVDELGLPIVADDATSIYLGRTQSVAYGITDPLTSNGAYRAWPGGRVPYVLAKDANGNIQIDATNRTRLSQVMTAWEQLTEGRVKFRPATNADKAYVIVKRGSTLVRPFVGYRKDKVQELYLDDSEYVTVIRHELGHVLGLHHEQRRSDRLDHIQVRMQNVVDSDHCRYQFSACADCTNVGAYDTVSVMQYRTTDLAGCRNGPVLLKLDGSPISHVWKISAKDLDVIATMYPATTPQPDPPASLPESGSLVGDGACASIAGASDGEGAAVQARACDGAGDQDWRITANGQLRVSHSLMCASVAGCSEPGAPIEQVTCADASPAQQWTFAEMSIVHGSTQTCLEAAALGAGATLALAACRDTPEQRFAYRADTETLELGGSCVTAGESGDALTMAPCDGRDDQRWFQARGGFVSRANTASCMRATGEPGVAATVGVGACTDSVEQRWALRGTIRDARSQLCLQTAAPGAPLVLGACDGATTATWTFWSR